MTFKQLHALPQLPASLGQKTSAASLSVVLASDYTLSVTLDNGGAANDPLYVRLTDGSTAYDGPLRAQLPTTIGQKAAAASLSVILASDQGAVPASQSGTWNITNVSGVVSLPTGAATEATLTALSAKVIVAAATGGNAATGKINGTALTSFYATVVTPTFNVRIVNIFNSCDDTINISLDGGANTAFELEAGESVSVDLWSADRFISSGVNLSAKAFGSLPTLGSVRIAVIG